MSDERDNPVSGATIQSRGYHAQASYMIVPPRVEVAVRYAAINPDTDVDDAQVRELRGVLGYYWQGHGLKLLADVGRIGYDSQVGALSSRARQGLPSVGPRLVSDRELSDIQFRVEVTLAF